MTSKEILQKYWGYKEFRPLQEEIINSILNGQDTLALLPTGGGKSICFQVPAMTLDGFCLVITPLIALIKDQVQNLRNRNIKAEAIHSGMSSFEIERALNNCIYGQTKFLYVAPERLQTELFQARLTQMKINLVAIDEAHCISQWGYDFRPSYLKIADIRKHLPKIPFLALTATATKTVKADIQEKLLFNKFANVFQKSYTRNNLSFSVLHEADKFKKLIDILQKVSGCGIIYVRSRNRAKDIAEALKQHNIKADFYHAGLDPKTRNIKQEGWIKDKIRIIVCTNAFGMGIDKPDVRLVIHLDLPNSLEAYFQEAGRAGRDELKAYAVLLFNNSDAISLEKNFQLSFPPIETVQQIYHLLSTQYNLAMGAGEGQRFDFDIKHFISKHNLPSIQCYYALKILEENGYIETTDAVFNSSRLIMKVPNESLYDIQLRNPQLEPFIKILLRTYGGLFDHYTDINENHLARILNTSEEYVHNTLIALHRNQIIDYIPQTDKPKLIFTRERVPYEKLFIDTKLIAFRKKVRQSNMEAAIKYAQNGLICRSQQLVTYFGEFNSQPCNICDVCLQRNKSEVQESTIKQVSEAIIEYLKFQPSNLKCLISQLKKYKEEEVLKTIRWMTDNGQITYTDGYFTIS